MNAKKNMKILISAGLLAAMMTAPACMLAAETSAHVPNTVEMQNAQERLPSFRKAEACRGVSVSNNWLRQVRLNGTMLNIRLHTPMGEEILFREMLGVAPSDESGLCLYMQAARSGDALTMQLDQPAINALNNLGVVEIVLADENRSVRAHYMVSELQAVRNELALADAEQLCVSGEDAPVTVVSEDGVRRHINP
jgi:hypothetical protein